ncbi:MAG: glycerol-3-phosphate dehydrogenase [Hyphomicrobiaceae bacterium]|nr:glycerol-3-phosphate dehydrogenase [Hyphomicrobiaceae bacterium]
MSSGNDAPGPLFDVAIIGGGINGCGIARDAAGRGLSVALFEKDDLASGTSSASTKLIHGGLRYLEHYELRLVREALIEREVLWAMAPHIIRPMRFVLPHHPAMRPAWLLRLGLFIYDHLGGRKALPPTRTLALASDTAGKALRPGLFQRAFEYSDCGVDDARLVVLNARDAADRGALVRTRCAVEGARRGRDRWHITTTDVRTGKAEAVAARVLVNAAGPWVDSLTGRLLPNGSSRRTRLVRGSHIVVPRLFDHDRAYILQNEDQRIVFAIPYEGRFTLVGTTDCDHTGPLENIRAAAEEVAYLCGSISSYFAATVRPDDVVWSYAGVRSLHDDGAEAAQAATRDYRLELETDGGAALLTVLGGKITTYRRLAEEALAALAPCLPGLGRAGWTRTAPLPGGDFPIDGCPALVDAVADRYPGFDRPYLERLVRAYGTRAERILAGVRSPDDLGEHFGAGLHEAEVRYLARQEWAETAADVVWRRSKLGLSMRPTEIARLDDWLARERAAAYGSPTLTPTPASANARASAGGGAASVAR